MNNSVAFQQFANHLLAQGYPKFIFDLASCDGFDSTFMGIVLGIRQAGRLVVIVNTSAMHRKTLGEVGTCVGKKE